MKNRYLERIMIGFVFMALNASVHGADYYANVDLSDGDSLKISLHELIDHHKVIPYTKKGNYNWFDGQNLDVWEALIYTDADCPVDDPQCGYVKLLYLDESRHFTQANRGQGGHGSWDREHVWPKSRGFSKTSQDGYTDLHHLRPADRNLNGTHSNFGFDEGGKIVYDKLPDGTKVETAARIDRTNNSFEPPDRAKGQVARMLFYMAIRYEPGDDEKPELMPDLYLVDDNQRVKENWIGDLCTLLSWNQAFPPNRFEKRRNDRVFHLQGNRNPFIDYPQWASAIWGKQCYD